jgi:predicted ATPase
MLLYTARPEFRQPWPLRSHHTQVTLNRLSTRDTQKMIAQVAARHALPRETLDAVTERTSGVPLFVEELTRAVLEGSDATPGAHAIPETLHDSLMARRDRLGAAKEMAQLAAVIGQEFSYELLLLIAEIPEVELRTALTKLTDAELIYARASRPKRPTSSSMLLSGTRPTTLCSKAAAGSCIGWWRIRLIGGSRHSESSLKFLPITGPRRAKPNWR